MLWKTLSGLSVIALAVGLWFSYQTRLALEEEHKLVTRSKLNLTATKAEFGKATENKTTRTTELAEIEKQRDATKAEVATVTADVEQKTAEAEVTKKSLEEVTKQLTQLKDQVAKAGDIKKLMADVEDLNKQRQAAEASIANQQQQLALAEKKLTDAMGDVARLQDLDKRQRSGIVEPDFTARVSQVFLGYGFVILNKGNTGGLPVNAVLDVKRGKNVVAKLKVRDVENAMAVADVVPGSLANGDAVRSGDLVVPSPKAAENKAPAPAAPAGAAPAPAAAPAAPAAAPAMADPFAAPAAGMAPAAPAAAAPPAAAADPFAAPPAAAAPAAPAAPAAGTTPAAPAAVDPFAPAPPK